MDELPFEDLAFDVAKERAAAQGRLLLVDATAQWCAPCRIMDRATWPDPAVREWVGRHALAIQLDVDESQAVAQKLAIRAMPTVVVFRDGEEVDRKTGLTQPKQLVAWLDGLLAGRTEMDELLEAVATSPTDVDARHRLARKLVDASRWEEASEELQWLWEHAVEHEPAMVGVRNSFLVEEIRNVIARHPPARERFARLRDDHEAKVRAGDRSREHVSDFITLCDALGEGGRVLDWLDEEGAWAFDEVGLPVAFESRVIPWLGEAGRWADACRLYRDPVEGLRTRYEDAQRQLRAPLPEGISIDKEEMRAAIDNMIRRRAGAMYEAFLAADREVEAEEIAAEIRRLIPGDKTERALASAAERVANR